MRDGGRDGGKEGGSELVRESGMEVAVRPATLYGLESVALTKRQEAEMEVGELKMLRFSLGVTRMDKISLGKKLERQD